MIVTVHGPSHYEQVPIERLAELIHPDAAVFWDRDMGDHELAEGVRREVNSSLSWNRAGGGRC